MLFGGRTPELRKISGPRVHNDSNQRRHIALGGFAAELILYNAGGLLKEDGTVPTQKEFIDYAYRNAADDFVSFWGTGEPSAVGKNQTQMDCEFINFATGRAKNEMRTHGVERIADALLAANKLTETEVLEAEKEIR